MEQEQEDVIYADPGLRSRCRPKGGGLSPAFVFSILIKSPLVAVANGTGLSVVHFYSYLIFQRTQYRGGENARSIGKICSKPGLIGLHAPTVADKIDLHCTQCIA